MTKLAQTEVEKDLDVYITNDLKPSTQCAKAALKASSSLGIIRKSFSYLDSESLSMLYKCYVRPHIEYCIQAWRPYLKKT